MYFLCVSKTSRPLYYIYSGYHPITAKQACPDQCLRTDCRRSRGLLCTVNRTIISSDRGLCLYKEQELAERSGRRLRRWRSKYGRARFRNGPSSTALNKVIPDLTLCARILLFSLSTFFDRTACWAASTACRPTGERVIGQVVFLAAVTVSQRTASLAVLLPSSCGHAMLRKGTKVFQAA